MIKVELTKNIFNQRGGSQQARALQAVLPFAQMPFNKKNDNKISFPILFDASGVLIPFNHIDHFVKNGVYYGKNLVAQKVITLDRTAEMNSNGFVLTTSGAGKTTHRSGEFFAKVYKRIRKYGGVPTAITQNITEVLTSAQAKTMLLNSKFVVLLQQRKEDLDTLKNLFSLSPSKESYLKTGKTGSGKRNKGKGVCCNT